MSILCSPGVRIMIPRNCLLIVFDMKTQFNRVKTASFLSGPFRTSCRHPPDESSTDGSTGVPCANSPDFTWSLGRRYRYCLPRSGGVGHGGGIRYVLLDLGADE